MKINNKQGIRELYKNMTKNVEAQRVEGSNSDFKSAVQSASVAETNASKNPSKMTSESVAQDYDQVLLETDEQSIRSAAQSIKEAPDIREARVNEIAEQIKNGTYNVDPEAVAERLLASGVLNDAE